MMKSVFIFFLLFVNYSYSTTYYVDDLTGSDINSGKSILLAWKTLEKINGFTFSIGDTISFKCGGRYSGTTISGKSNITFNSYGTGPKPVIDGESARNCFNFDNQTNIAFNGLRIVNGGGGDISQDIGLWNTSHVIIENCNIDSSKGANIHNVGIYAGGGSSFLTIRNSTISYGEQKPRTGNLGIYIDACDNTLLEYDTLDGNYSGIRIAMGGSVLDTSRHDVNWTDNLIVRYCVIKNNNWDGIDDDGSYQAQFYYNIFMNNTISVYIFTNGDSRYTMFSAMYPHYFNNTFIQSNSHAFFEYTPPSDIAGQVVSTGLDCKNNIFFNRGKTGYLVYHPWGTPPKEFTFANNIWFAPTHKWIINNNKTSSFTDWQKLGFDPKGAYSDPLFNNFTGGDYSLKSKSRGLNGGTPVGLTNDIRGYPVPKDSPDIGAIQH